MHDAVAKQLARFYELNRALMDSIRIAELGALDLNGSCRSIVPIDTGFDIVEGPGVDEAIVPGEIPSRFHHTFGAVVSVSSFQFCPDPSLYRQQILDLLVPRGLLFLTMCAPSCTYSHSSSNNAYAFTDGIRLTLEELRKFFSPEFREISCFEVVDEGHGNLIYVGQLN
jgi:hypothetical protein